MPSLDQHQSNEFVKILIIGNSKAGKTGSCISLLKAGYKLFFIDLDNLLDPLKYFALKECPELLKNVEFRTLRDKRMWTPEGPKVVNPKAYGDAVRMMEHWKYGDTDFGRPAEWGPDCILIIDSLSRLCDAAYDWREPLTPRGKTGQYDARATYGDAQDAVENNLAHLTSDNFKTNIIVIGHVVFQEMPDKTIKGFPQGIGAKLSPKIPTYFPTILLYESIGGRRTIRTNSTPLIDLANPKPFEVGDKYPIETGLADIFTVLTGREHAGSTNTGKDANKGVVQSIQRQPSGQGQVPVRRTNRPV